MVILAGRAVQKEALDVRQGGGKHQATVSHDVCAPRRTRGARVLTFTYAQNKAANIDGGKKGGHFFPRGRYSDTPYGDRARKHPGKSASCPGCVGGGGGRRSKRKTLIRREKEREDYCL